MNVEFEYRSEECRGQRVTWEGHELVTLENRHVRVAVSLTRGAEILELRDKATDADLLWHGHPDIVAARPGIPTTTVSGGAFLDHFAGGWQEVFPTGGDPSEYGGAVFGQHGEVALLPWDFSVVVDTEEVLVVDFRVRSRRFPLALRRRMTIRADHAGVRLDETITNPSDLPIPYMWGHHIAIGGRWASPGAALDVADGVSVTVPQYDWPSYRWRSGEYRWPHVTRTDDGIEDVRALAHDDGSQGHLILGPLEQGRVALDVPDLGRRVTVEWPVEAYPYSWCWFVYGGNAHWPLWGQHRLITIEPFTSPVEEFAALVTRDAAPILAAGASTDSYVVVTFSGLGTSSPRGDLIVEPTPR